MLNLISTAEAATANGAAPESNLASLLMIVVFVVVFYFMFWRPQAQRAKDQRNLLANLALGDEVTTSGGIVGKITKLGDDFIVLALNDTLEIKMQRIAVVAVLPKGTLKAL